MWLQLWPLYGWHLNCTCVDIDLWSMLLFVPGMQWIMSLWEVNWLVTRDRWWVWIEDCVWSYRERRGFKTQMKAGGGVRNLPEDAEVFWWTDESLEMKKTMQKYIETANGSRAAAVEMSLDTEEFLLSLLVTGWTRQCMSSLRDRIT